MPDIKRTFTIEDLMDENDRRASDMRLKPQNPGGVRGEVVGQVRRDRRRTQEQSEKLIREFMKQQSEEVVFLDICDHLERRPSPILRGIVKAMVDSGELLMRVDQDATSSIPRYLYRMNRRARR